jgi:hypothetical protein
MYDATLLQRSTRNQTGSGGFVALLSGLPPIRIVLRHYVQNVAALKAQPGLLARYVRIIFRIVLEMGSHTNLALALPKFTIGRYDFEGDCAFGVLLRTGRKSLVIKQETDCIGNSPKSAKHQWVSCPPH